MTIKKLIAELSKLPEDGEVVSIEADDWQDVICNNEWRLLRQWFDGAKMIMLEPK